MAGSPLGVTYYPSCVVNMRVMFDEAYQLKGTKTFRNYTADQLNAITGPILELREQGGLLEINTDKNKEGSHITARIPIKASVELMGVRKPGKFSLIFDYRVLPIDPRLIRSAAVEIYMDTVPASDFATGVTSPSTPGGERISQLTSARRMSTLTPSVGNLVMQGLMDNWRVQHTSSGSTVHIEGRDMTGLFLNTPITPTMVKDLDLAQPINKVVEQIAYKMNGWVGKIAVNASDPSVWPKGQVPRLANLAQLDASVPRVRRSAKTGKVLRRSPGSRTDKLNFWDLITRYCNFVGAVPYFTVQPVQNASPGQSQYMPTIMIAPQQNLYDQLGLSDRNTPSPFKDGALRTDDQGNKFKVRRLLFGRNIEELSLERKFQGITARAVKVVCYDNGSEKKGTARLLEAISTNRRTYAEAQGVAIATDTEAAGRSGVSPNGELEAKDILTIQVYGVKKQEDLQAIADGLYNEIMRGETGGNVKTRSLTSFGAGAEDPDLIRIRPMDGIAIFIVASELHPRAPIVSPLNSYEHLDTEELTKELTKQLGDANLADAIVSSGQSYRSEYNTTYRVNAVKFDWDVKSGISIALDFQNYVIPRNSIFPTAKVATPAAIRRAGRGVATPPTRSK